MLAFAAPPLLRSGPIDEATLEKIANVLSIDRKKFVDSQWIDNGPGWAGILLSSAEEVLSIKPVMNADIYVGLFGPYGSENPAKYEVRAFFPEDGKLVEDPATGSLNASGAQWLVGCGRFTPPYKVS